MKTVASTIISSNFEKIGTRVCNECGIDIPIYRIKTEFQEREVSECLNCDTSKLQKKCQAEYENMEKDKNLAIFKKFSMIPFDIANARFSNYKPGHPSTLEAKQIAMKFAKDFQNVKQGNMEYNSLLFQGSYGVGKSHLAHSIAEEVLKKGFSVIFLDTPQLLQLFRNNIQTKEMDEQRIMKAFSEASLVILDDLGAEYIKQENGRESWAVDKLFQLMSIRGSLPKVITTNYDSKNLREKYGTHGGRIVSRMMMGTRFVKMEGNDYRIKKYGKEGG